MIVTTNNWNKIKGKIPFMHWYTVIKRDQIPVNLLFGAPSPNIVDTPISMTTIIRGETIVPASFIKMLLARLDIREIAPIITRTVLKMTNNNST